MIVNRHVDKFPAHSPRVVARTTGDPMARALDPPQLFGVEVDQLAGHGWLVALHRRPRLQFAPTAQPGPPPHTRHGRSRHAQRLRNQAFVRRCRRSASI